jgi:hypothetical protein
MDRVISPDGTPIAIERAGDGPVVVLVGGGLDDGSELRPMMVDLAGRGLTAVNYQRRGRGESGDTQPYTVAREIEDLAAVIGASGGQAHLFGASSGGALALEPTAAGLSVDRLAVYEVPYVMAEEMLTRWRAYVARLHEALALSDRGLTLEHFLRVAGSSDGDIAGLKVSPYWLGMDTLAPTLAYDAACLGDGRPPGGPPGPDPGTHPGAHARPGRSPDAGSPARLLRRRCRRACRCAPERHTRDRRKRQPHGGCRHRRPGRGALPRDP